MVTFLTLFIGVVTGMQSVQVAVTGPVAHVVLYLDAEPVATLTAPRWEAVVPLGGGLEPRALTAVAFDRTGAELGRDRQLLNLPQERADARIVPVADGASTRVRAAHLVWWAPGLGAPQEIRFSVDGRPVPATRSETVDLSPFADDRTHLLEAQLEFAEGVECRRTFLFGGGRLAATAAELTAVPVIIAGKHMPHPGSWKGWFRAADEPLDVDAVDQGPATVVFVRDLGVRERLISWWSGRRPAAAPGVGWEELALQRARGSGGGFRHLPRRSDDRLGKGVAMHLGEVEPAPSCRPLPRPVSLFAFSAPVSGEHSVAWLLTRPSQPSGAARQRRVADAVEMAANLAAHDDHRRAVVLCLGAGGPDDSDHDVAAVRRSLRALRVPLVVWDLHDAKESSPAAVDGAWGEPTSISTPRALFKAARRLERLLQHERIVWVRGERLPQEIRLGPNAHDLTLAGDSGP